jgi:hypothetical protein
VAAVVLAAAEVVATAVVVAVMAAAMEEIASPGGKPSDLALFTCDLCVFEAPTATKTQRH